MSWIQEQPNQDVTPSPMATLRVHRADLQQWMLGLVTTQDGDVPLFMRPLDGTSLDKVSISTIVGQVMEQLRASQSAEQEEPMVVIDLGGYSQANMKAYNQAKIRWCSRVPETSTEAKAALNQQPSQWQEFTDRSGHYFRLQLSLPQGEERWLIVRTKANLEKAQETLQKKANKDHSVWEKRLQRLGRESFAWKPDAQTAWEKEVNKLPVWLRAEMSVVAQPHYGKAGRHTAETEPVRIDWKIMPSVQIDQQALELAIDRKARDLFATNELTVDRLSGEALLEVDIRARQRGTGFSFPQRPLVVFPPPCL